MKNYEKKLMFSLIVLFSVFTALFSQSTELANKYFDQAKTLYKRNKYLEAAQMFEKSAEAEKHSGQLRLSDLSSAYNNAGYCYKQVGQYDKAIEYYREALEINRRLGKEAGVAIRLNNIGAVYKSWGQYDKAIEYYRKALEIDKRLGKEAGVARDLNNIGGVYDSWGQYDKAIEYYRKALEIAKRLGKEAGVAILLNNIAGVYYSWGQYDKAIEYYRKALEIDKRLGKEDHVAVYLNNIGLVYKSWGQYDKAIEYYRKALEIGKKLGDEEGVAIRLNNIGVACYYKKKYADAIDNLERSVRLKEKLRKTATGAVRRDYLASQIGVYQWLISAYIKNKNPDKAFNTAELSSAKYLAEQLAGKLKEEELRYIDINTYKTNIASKTAVVKFANMDWDTSARIISDPKKTYAVEVSDSSFLADVTLNWGKEISNTYEKLRGMKLKPATTSKDKIALSTDKKQSTKFEKTINYYRFLLSIPHKTSKQKENLKQLSKKLYTFLFGDIEKYIADKRELVILPDGILGFLPFETLIMPDGRYLCEKYVIKYTQSLTVSDIIEKRRYSANKKPLLAMGGAVYEERTYTSDMIEKEWELSSLMKDAQLAMVRGAGLSEYYSRLGIGKWKNLPGTLVEAKAVSELFPGSELITGKILTEKKFKKASKSGVLVKYKVIHIATHGIVVPEVPEMSAIVLSQDKDTTEDGYLRMNEIAQLNLQADFVNLSACETGLGKIYGGEGVVGLTQAFLLAGANGLSVSLWQVADESTKKFMIAMYKEVIDENKTYAQAISDIKRDFINGRFGDKYRDPFFWGPFVYYGK